MLGGLHGLVKGREMAHAQGFMGRYRCQVQVQAPEPGQGAFGAHQKTRQVQGFVIAGDQFVDVVAANPPQQVWKAGGNFCGFPLAQCQQFFHQWRGLAEHEIGAFIHGPEGHRIAVGQQGINGMHVVHHVAVTNRTRAAGVVAGHATQCGAVGGGDIYGIPQAMGL